MSVNFGGSTSECRRLGRVVTDTLAFNVSGCTTSASGHTRASMVPTEFFSSPAMVLSGIESRYLLQYNFVLLWLAVQCCSNCLLLLIVLHVQQFRGSVAKHEHGQDQKETRIIVTPAIGGARLLHIRFIRESFKSASLYFLQTAGDSVARDGL